MVDFTPFGDENAQLSLLNELRSACNKFQRVQHSIWRLRGAAHRSKGKDPSQTFRKHDHEEYRPAMADLRSLCEMTERLHQGEYCPDSGLDYTINDVIGKMALHIVVREEFDDIKKTAHSAPREDRRLPVTEQMRISFLDNKQVLLKDLADLELLVGNFKREVIAKIDSIQLTMYASS